MKNELHMLSHLPLHKGQMNSFVIKTDDGRLIVIDGGYRRDGEKLLTVLRRLSGCGVPRVDAWFLSHVHSDHVGAFLELVEHHADAFSCDALYYNFPSMHYVEKYEPSDYFTYVEFSALLPRFAHFSRVASVGDEYTVGSARFEILATPDTVITHNAINNTTLIFRARLGEKSILFLGDAGVEQGELLLARYGKELKSDVCQMAHHGQNGVGQSVYEAVSPEVCLWCTPEWLWNNDVGKGFDTHIFKTVEVRGWMEKLGVSRHLVTKDGDLVLAL